ncbi:DinB family protein [Chitinimonas sp. BJYL2]|uniref:DinB family protein n=1 Tax=Chitinimonas sp. BJYL2 TaxID=2976696 RepID=UPI0022B56FB9|nr:DinB family protein [Chitinimonas sp. BJYL2]
MSSTLISLFGFKTWAQTELFEAVATLSAEQYAEARHTAIRILNHIHVVDRIFVGNLQGVAHGYTATNTPETPELAALQRAANETDRWYQDYVARLSPTDLAQPMRFTFTDGDAGTMTHEEMLLHVITHGGYHRGAVGRILAQCGVAPPRELYTKFLHQSEPQRRG